MLRCKNCVLPTSHPGVEFDEKGVCNFCKEHEKSLRRAKSSAKDYEKLEKDAEGIINENRGKGEYDCMVTFSGGKDSAYALYLAKEKYGLKPLAVTMDHWLLSNDTKRNINSVLKKLGGVDHITVKYSWNMWKTLYRSFILKSGMSPRAICWSCNFVSERIIYQTLQKYKIPLYISGNPGGETDAFKKWLIGWMREFKVKPSGNENFDYWNVWHVAYRELLEHVLEHEDHAIIDDCIPPKPDIDDQAVETITFPLLGYMKYYPEKNVKEIKEKLGWKLPQDVGGTQNDCIGMQFNVNLYKKIHGVHEYDAQISEIVRKGETTREIGLRAVNFEDPKTTEWFFKELDLSWDDFKPDKCSPILKKWLGLLKPIK